MKNALLSSTASGVESAPGNSSFGGTGSVVTYAVTQTGTYTIVADGAQGGSSTDGVNTLTGAGGIGAEVSATFALTAGETIEIAVGVAGSHGKPSHKGTTSGFYGDGGGGGGTFVELVNGGVKTVLEVAGGGGGSANGKDGNAGTTGAAGSGSGGNYQSVSYEGGNGGGLNGAGTAGTGGGAYGGAGQGYNGTLAGGAGGVPVGNSYGTGGAGGFGGGGGGGGYVPSSGYAYGGGGGGYTGGIGGHSVSSAGGYGGTSFVGAAALAGSTEGASPLTGNGLVTITEQACFAAGTRIETDRGPVAVELLRDGDYVRLAREDAFAPIAWIGHRTVDCACHPRPDAVLPVRVRAHAFGPGLPARDLILSPDHAVFVDDVLIPVRHLLNGATIVRERRPSVTYWHVELECHDILLAEGLACESYLDTGNRAAFANGGPVISAHPQFDPVHAMAVWEADSCAPLVTAGVARDAVHALSLATAADLGHQITDDPALALLVDGRTVRGSRVGRLLRFDLPEGARDIRLASRRFVPAELFTGAHDRRALGAAITEVWVDGDFVELVHLDPADGWFAPEQDASAEWRWTDGHARLHCPGARAIEIESLSAGQYWTSAAIVAAEASRAA